MYPTIPDLIQDIIGVDLYFLRFVNTFGFFMALAFLASAFILDIELKRKEKANLLSPFQKKVLKGKPATTFELIFNAIIGFIFGFKLFFIITDYDIFINDPQGTILSLKGNIIGGIIGAALLGYLKYREKQKHRLDKPVWEDIEVHPYQLVGNIVIIAAIAGLIGAKLFHNLEYIEDVLKDPLESLISFSGLTFYGGLIFGTASVLYYAKKNHIPMLHMLDTAAPALMLAYGIGRIGCQMAGDGDWGIDNINAQPAWLSFLPEWTWAFNYPHNVINEGIPIANCIGNHCYMLATPVYPTPLYESVISIILFAVLWAIRKRILLPGMLFAVYLILNGFERFFIEKIRVNAVYHILGKEITQAEIISLLLVLIGIAGIIYLKKNKGKIF